MYNISFLISQPEYEPDELNPSLYSFHSNVDEKNKLLYSFSQQGIETVVDRVAKKNRIKDWIQSSIITEEDELEASGDEKIQLNIMSTLKETFF